MTSDLTQYSDLDCVGDVLLDLVVGQEALASTFAFTVLGLLPSRIPEEDPYTDHRYPSEWTNACFKIPTPKTRP